MQCLLQCQLHAINHSIVNSIFDVLQQKSQIFLYQVIVDSHILKYQSYHHFFEFIVAIKPAIRTCCLIS